MSKEENKETNVELTATEISNIWAAYLHSSMECRIFEYFYNTAEDSEIKKVLNTMLNEAMKNIEEIKKIFVLENLAVPLGFTKEDVRLNAPKVFSDVFILHFCHDLTMITMSTFPSALSDSTRKDIRKYFQANIDFTMNIQNEIIDLMLLKGVYLRPPQVAVEKKVDFVDEKKYLSGLFGGSRPINAAEVANLSRIIHRAQFSKMIFVAFSKLASTGDVEQYFSKGRDGIQKVLDSLQAIFEEENVPISASSNYNILDTETSPFSDKLMMFFINTCIGLFCFTMLCQALTSSFRYDIISKINEIMNDMRQYYGKGILLTINEGWLEKPPQLIDRK